MINITEYEIKDKYINSFMKVGEVYENDISATFYNVVLKIIFPKTSVKQEHKKE